MAFLVGGANSAAADTGYDVENSCRFDEASDASLGGTFGTPTEAKAFTLSMWFKRAGMMGTIQTLLGPGSLEGITLWSDEKMTMYWDNGNGGFINWAPLLRDHSAWYHFVIAQDTAQGTDTNRVKFYLNGTQITTLSNQTSWPAQDLVGGFNEDGQAFYISTYNASARPVGGYCAEVAFIDGLQYAASNFGETDEDSGIWKPKEFKDDVTFGNNGFYLEFKQSGVGTNASGLGADTSGNDNHLAVTNLAAIDQCTDTPTNNFCTMNPLSKDEMTFSEGNCKVVTASDPRTDDNARGTMGVSSGKWYWEVKGSGGTVPVVAGICFDELKMGSDLSGLTGVYAIQNAATTYAYRRENGTTAETAGFPNPVNDDIINLAFDADNAKLYIGINGSYYSQDGSAGDPAGGSNETYASIDTSYFWLPWIESRGASQLAEMNFGGSPAFTVSSGNADANGYGNFEYAVPSGYYALCTKNLAEYG